MRPAVHEDKHAMRSIDGRRRRDMREILMVVALALIGTGGVARAQTEPMAQPPAPPVTPPPSQPAAAPQPKGFHEHDGFFLQMELAGGVLSDKYTSMGNAYELSGPAAGFSVAVGGAVLPNFILAGQLWLVSVSSPTVKENGQSFSTPGDTSLDLSGVGVNLTY
jgi:hypothetical protein